MRPPTHNHLTKKGFGIAFVGACSLFVAFAIGLDAQEIVVPKEVEGKAKTQPGLHRDGDNTQRHSLEYSGYTRPGNPDDKTTPEGKLIATAAFAGKGLQKFKIMGGTVYFAVFRNTGITEGDTFGTGMTNFDSRFHEGRSFNNSFSPRFDKQAKYLYLYQVVNDRGLDPRHRPDAGKQGKSDLKNAVADLTKSETTIAPAEELGSFSQKLYVDPRYITSWGGFSGAGFASNVVDATSTGQPVKNVAFEEGKKVERERDIRLAFSFAPAIEQRIEYPAFGQRARAYPLAQLSAGFGVDQATINLQDSKVAHELKEVAAKLEKDNIKLMAHMEGRLKAIKSANEPDYVQLMFLSNEERLDDSAVNNPNTNGLVDDDVTRSIFRADWRQANTLKQGEHSVVFGYTSDLPPVGAPIRIDTPKAAVQSEGMRLVNYFADSPIVRAGGTAPNVGAAAAGDNIALAAAGLDPAALSLALGSALGQAASPVPPPAAAGGGGGGGFAGATGGMGSMGGMAPGGMGGGMGFPSLGGAGLAGRGGGIGGGGGLSGGGGLTGGGTNGSGTGTTTGTGNTNSNVPAVNFVATLTNQQQQQQQQQQGQGQTGGNCGGGNCGGGHVVPAPASLLLGLLGLPGFLLLRRRKTDATSTDLA